jgi:hypothetical protein
MQLSFKDAASLLGHRSRSTIYRWLKDGFLKHEGYLRGTPGHYKIESDPGDGVRPFKEWAAAITGPQGPMRRSELHPAPEPPAVEPDSFWSRYGRIAGPGEQPLSEDDAAEHSALMVWHLLEPLDTRRPPADRFRFWLWQIEKLTEDAREDVAAGARFDQARWDSESARGLLDDMPCDSAAEMLRRLRDLGRIPAELLASVTEAVGDE